MTREETLTRFKSWCQNHIGNDCSQDDYQMASNIIALLEQEPCEDAISRERAIKQCGFGMTNLLVADCLRRLPPVTPKQRTGHWVEIGDEPYDTWECDNCGFVIDGSGCVDPEEYRDTFKYCPNCGAKMEGE